MPDDRTDRIARAAARLLALRLAGDIDEAIDAAVVAAGPGAPRPGWKAVRAHARGMAMQALGREGYTESIRAVWRLAEEFMTTLEEARDDAATLLCGRAAKGEIDAGVTLHIRVYTDAPMVDLVDWLCARGYDEPKFETADTRFGRLDRARFIEDEHEIVLTRCPTEDPRLSPDREANRDLFKGRPIAIATLRELRAKIG